MTIKLSIIKGTIYNEKMELVYNSVIQVSEIDPITKLSKILGYTTTDINGSYAFALEASEDKFYELSIYPPLNA